jgi:hypothetical protein
METWKEIENFPNYQVSDLGNVKSLDHETFNCYNKTNSKYKGKILNPVKSSCGYFIVRLCNKGKIKPFQIHQLVAQAFIGPCPTRKEVDHKNGDHFDNKASNLQYITHPENVQKGKRAKLSPVQVKEIKEKYSSGIFTQKQLSKEFKVSFQHISDICNDKHWIL